MTAGDEVEYVAFELPTDLRALVVDVRFAAPIEIHSALVLAGQMLADRLEIDRTERTEEIPAESNKPRQVALRVSDDWEELVTGLHTYWGLVRPIYGAKHSPAWTALQDLVASGRSVNMSILSGPGVVVGTGPAWAPVIEAMPRILANELGSVSE